MLNSVQAFCFCFFHDVAMHSSVPLPTSIVCSFLFASLLLACQGIQPEDVIGKHVLLGNGKDTAAAAAATTHERAGKCQANATNPINRNLLLSNFFFLLPLAFFQFSPFSP